MSGRLSHGHTAYEMLTAAGAPPLPAEHFYRIKQETHSDHVVRVEVRKIASLGLGSNLLGWSTFSTRADGTAVDATVDACIEAHAEAFPNGAPA